VTNPCEVRMKTPRMQIWSLSPRTLFRSVLVAMSFVLFGTGSVHARTVDLALVLLVDVSGSIDPMESQLQFAGYAEAFSDPRVIAAMTKGPNKSIAVSVVAFTDSVNEYIPWTVLDGPESAAQFAQFLVNIPYMSGAGTFVADGLEASINHVSRCPFDFAAATIDLSGDGWDNKDVAAVAPALGLALVQGFFSAFTGGTAPTLDPALLSPATVRRLQGLRDYAAGQGITINCIAIEDPSLEEYFRKYVAGGPGAFTTFAPSFETFTQVIFDKLFREISEGVKISEERQSQPSRISERTNDDLIEDTPADPSSITSEPGETSEMTDEETTATISDAPRTTGTIGEDRPAKTMIEDVITLVARDDRSGFPVNKLTVTGRGQTQVLEVEEAIGRPGMARVLVELPVGSKAELTVESKAHQPIEVSANPADATTEVRLQRKLLKMSL